jgi:hypothetical protein
MQIANRHLRRGYYHIWVGEYPESQRERSVYHASYVLEKALNASAFPQIELDQSVQFTVFGRLQTASGGDFVVDLGATFTPNQSQEVLIQVAVSGDEEKGLPTDFANAVFNQAIETFSQIQPFGGGTLRFDRAYLHPTDAKIYHFKLAARSIVKLLHDNILEKTDEEIYQFLFPQS